MLDLFNTKAKNVGKSEDIIRTVQRDPLFSVTVKKVSYANDKGFVILRVGYSEELHALFPNYTFPINTHNKTTIQVFNIKGNLGYHPEEGEVLSIGRLELEKGKKREYGDCINAAILSPEVVAQISETGELLIDAQRLTITNTALYICRNIKIKNLGLKTAEKLLSAFAKNYPSETEAMKKWYELAISDPEKFVEALSALKINSRLSQDDFLSLSRCISAKTDTLELDLLFQEHGISVSDQKKVKSAFGLAAIEKIKRNPYVLANITGIGFKKADAIARKFGLPEYSKQRLVASMDAYYRLKTNETGDTSIRCREFLDGWLSDLSFPNDEQHRFLLASIMTGLFCKQEQFKQYPVLDSNHKPVFDDAGKPLFCFSSQQDIRVDDSIIENLRRIHQNASLLNRKQIDDLKSIVERVDRVGNKVLKLDESQIKAIYTVLNSRISCLTGGAGCGKTTILKRIIECVKKLGMSVALCSPTGKAAKRMNESTGYEASTIHRLIGFSGKGGVIPEAQGASPEEKEKGRVISADWVFVDESSMIDSHLALALLKAVRNGARITFIGDPNQLPPVGKGCFFYDIIDSGSIPVGRLTKTHRQADGNDINDVAHAILTGNVKSLDLSNRKNVAHYNFDYMQNAAQGGTASQVEVNEAIQKKLVQKYVALVKEHGIKNVLIITAKRQTTALSSDVLNQVIRRYMFPEAMNLKPRFFVKGERVMGIKNVNENKGVELGKTFNPLDNNILNGEMGTVISDQENRLLVLIDGENKPRDLSGVREHLVLGYAITVHKSQGSEAKHVLTAVTNTDYIMLNREWFYTNVTRGKEHVYLFSQFKAINHAVRNTQARRTTLLRHLLNQLKPHKPAFTEKMLAAVKKLVDLETEKFALK